MKTKHLSYFKVENFKRFDSLEVNDIGQFNLIVGDNNVGKTTLLESLLFDEKYNQFLFNIFYLAVERGIKQETSKANFLDVFLKKKTKPLQYNFKYVGNEKMFDLSLDNRKRQDLNNDEITILSAKLALYPADNIIRFTLNNEIEYKFYSEAASEKTYYPYIAFRALYADDIINFFSQLSISTKWLENFKEDMKYFIPNLLSVEIGKIADQTLIFIRESNADIAQPLSFYGDGTIKLFRNLLELDMCESNRLMIDEIDAGVHYSRLKEYLKKVLYSAKNKNVQIFATTHSKECIQYYTQALQELGLENEGRIIRLADTKSGIKAYTMKFAEFENALFADSEIR